MKNPRKIITWAGNNFAEVFITAKFGFLPTKDLAISVVETASEKIVFGCGKVVRKLGNKAKIGKSSIGRIELISLS